MNVYVLDKKLLFDFFFSLQHSELEGSINALYIH